MAPVHEKVRVQLEESFLFPQWVLEIEFRSPHLLKLFYVFRKCYSKSLRKQNSLADLLYEVLKNLFINYLLL